jgi:DNA/RNA-binding domain of Phe-tRNA-synthetase-like protein
LETTKALLVAFGVPGISQEDLRISIEKTADILNKINAGKLENLYSS